MICLDNMVLISGVQGTASSCRGEMIGRARRYLKSLQESNEQIMVPTPALAEYLQDFEPEARKRQLEVFERHFLIPAFDLPAAYLAAGIARKAEKPSGVTRRAVKTDIQIIATAIVAGARLIVTDEAEHFERLASGRVQVSGVPLVHDQADLDFDD